MPGNAQVLVVGEVAVDVLVACGEPPIVWGQAETFVEDARVVLGSSGAICAAALAALGRPVCFAGVSGEDPLGRFFLGELRGFGVNVDAVRQAAGRATGITIGLHRAHDRGMLTFPGTMDAQRAEDIDEQTLARAAHLHVSSPFLQRGLGPGLVGLFTRARALGMTISLDPGFDPSERWAAPVQDTLGLIDWLLPNQTEALALASARTGRPVDEPADALDVLAAAGCSVVIKRGGDGAMLRSGGLTLRLDTDPCAAVDTTGAGDNFDAGFIDAVLSGLDPAAALAQAVVCGRHAVSARGGTGAMSDGARIAGALATLPAVQRGSADLDPQRPCGATVNAGGGA